MLALLDVPVTAETEYQHFLKVADALKETVAHARALRAALQEIATADFNRTGVYKLQDRAAAVLAAAQDGPA